LKKGSNSFAAALMPELAMYDTQPSNSNMDGKAYFWASQFLLDQPCHYSMDLQRSLEQFNKPIVVLLNLVNFHIDTKARTDLNPLDHPIIPENL
jgi:hypothetical protein